MHFQHLKKKFSIAFKIFALGVKLKFHSFRYLIFFQKTKEKKKKNCLVDILQKLLGSSYVAICITLLCRCGCYGNFSCCYGVVAIQIAMVTMRCFQGMRGSSSEIPFICRRCCVTDMVAMVTTVWWRLPLVAAEHVTRGGSPSPLLPAKLK